MRGEGSVCLEHLRPGGEGGVPAWAALNGELGSKLLDLEDVLRGSFLESLSHMSTEVYPGSWAWVSLLFLDWEGFKYQLLHLRLLNHVEACLLIRERNNEIHSQLHEGRGGR